MKEEIKKYWREIIICLLIGFSMNKCATSCNRASKINKQAIEILEKDSMIKMQADSLNVLKIRWNDAQKSQSTYQGIALGNQHNLINEVESLKNVIVNKDNQIKTLKDQNNKLKYENNKLKSK